MLYPVHRYETPRSASGWEQKLESDQRLFRIRNCKIRSVKLISSRAELKTKNTALDSPIKWRVTAHAIIGIIYYPAR